MQMGQLEERIKGHLEEIIKQQSPAGKKTVEKVDLDEKIRQIRQKNKERERRFKEIEQDKKLALDQGRINESPKYNVHIDNNQPMTMKGIKPTSTKKIAKGRGEKLRELSNYPLKAEHFKSRTKEHNASFEKYLSGEVKLVNNCRSSIRERIKTKNKNCAAVVHVVENTQENDVHNANDKLKHSSQDQQNEIPGNKILLHEDENSSQTTPQAFIDTVKSDDIKEETKPESHKEGNVSPCEENEQNSTETDKDLDNTPQEASASNSQLAEEPSTQKNNKPKIKVSLKKTASSSSLDASMAMLSPLDVPQNWGDIEFSDDELSSVPTW